MLQLGHSHKQKNLDLWNPKISFLCQKGILYQTYTSEAKIQDFQQNS